MDNLGLEKIGIKLDEEIPYSIIENFMFDIQGLSANKKLFLLMIRKYAGSKKEAAFPSYKTLMKDIGSNSPATIMKCIDFFVWLQWLERIPRKKFGTNENLSNLYMLSLKNMKIILEHFKKQNYDFREIEKYFESEYKIASTRKYFMSKRCKYLN